MFVSKHVWMSQDVRASTTRWKSVSASLITEVRKQDLKIMRQTPVVFIWPFPLIKVSVQFSKCSVCLENLVASKKLSVQLVQYHIYFRDLVLTRVCAVCATFSLFWLSVAVGSSPKVPAMSCLEIKASEGQEAVYGYYWLDRDNTGEAIQTYCYIGKG